MRRPVHLFTMQPHTTPGPLLKDLKEEGKREREQENS